MEAVNCAPHYMDMKKCVRMNGLPPGKFMESLFKKALQKFMTKHLGRSHEIICIMHFKTGNYVVIEFESFEVACQLRELPDFEFQKHLISIDQTMSMDRSLESVVDEAQFDLGALASTPSTSQLKDRDLTCQIAKWSPFEPAEKQLGPNKRLDTKATPPKMKKKLVHVYEESTLTTDVKPEISNTLTMAKVKDEPAVQTHEFNFTPDTIVIESSAEKQLGPNKRLDTKATPPKMKKKLVHVYEETTLTTDVKPEISNTLTMAKVKDEPAVQTHEFDFTPDTIVIESSEEESNDVVDLKNSCHVCFSVSPSMDLDSFIEMLKMKMVSAKFIENLGETFIEKFSLVEGNFVVEFSSCEFASLALLLDNYVYVKDRCYQLKMKRILPPSAKEQNDVQNSVAPISDDQELLVPLDSEEGTVIFIKLLIKFKSSFPKSGSFDTILERIRRVLIRKNVITTVSALRDLREKLRNNYTKCKKRNKTSCKHYSGLDVAFGDAELVGQLYDPGQDLELEEEPCEVKSTAAAARTAVAAWSVDGAKALIGICRDNQEDYDKPISHAHFWTTIKTQLKDKHGLDYSAQQCESKVSALRATYNDLIGDAGTGAEGLILRIRDKNFRELMEMVHELIGDSVAVKPKLTVGAGFKYVYKRRSKSPKRLKKRRRCSTKERRCTKCQRNQHLMRGSLLLLN